jgi:hypothetical protein
MVAGLFGFFSPGAEQISHLRKFYISSDDPEILGEFR